MLETIKNDSEFKVKGKSEGKGLTFGISNTSEIKSSNKTNSNTRVESKLEKSIKISSVTNLELSL